MKRMLSIGLLLLCMMAACNNKKQVPEPEVAEPSRSIEGPALDLSTIDSLMWQRPDSALALLLPWFDTCCRDAARHVSTMTEYNRHYANLLLAELLYKNDYEQTNRTELLQAVAYYDSLLLADTRGVSLRPRLCRDASHASANTSQSITFLAARAHYMNGVGYYENDSAVPACEEYLKVLEVMEEHFEEEELVGKRAQFTAYTYTRLTDLFSDLYLHEQAIYYAKLSLPYYKKQNSSSWHSSRMLNEIGCHYDIMGNYDSALYYYCQGKSSLNDTNCLTYRDITSHLAYLSYEKGLSSSISIIQLTKLLTKAESIEERTSRCLTIGEVYYHEKEFDSAWHYLKKVYDQTHNIASKKQAAEWLAEIAKTQSRNSESFEFANFLVPFATMEENQSGTKSQLTLLYNESKQARLDYQHHKETQKNIKIVMIIIGGLVLVIFSLYYRSLKHKKILERERQAHKIQQAAMAGRLKRSYADLKEREKKHESATVISSHQHQKSTENYLDEPICKHILGVCNDKSNPIKSTVPVSAYANIALSDIQKAQIKDAAMLHYGLLFETLKQRYPELKEKDFFYCYLCLLGLDNMQIAVLQQNSISTIWDRENRLKKILGSDSKVSVTLHEIMNS